MGIHIHCLFLRCGYKVGRSPRFAQSTLRMGRNSTSEERRLCEDEKRRGTTARSRNVRRLAHMAGGRAPQRNMVLTGAATSGMSITPWLRTQLTMTGERVCHAAKL